MSKKQKYSDNCVLVVDVESTCDQNVNGEPREEFISEIIEIGYAVLNYKDNEILEKGSIVVKPVESVITPFCTNLTGWTQEAVDRGISFEEACRTVNEDLKGGSRLWASYGDYDRAMFDKMCRKWGVKYPFTPQHLNIKAMSTTLLGGVGGVGRTMTRLGLNFEGRQHSGVDDAYNIARILKCYKERFNIQGLK